MANHKSALKRKRSDAAKQLRNRYQAKTARTLIKKLRTSKDKKEAQALFPKVSALIDKLAKRNIIHKNKAGNLKSSLSKQIRKMQ